MKNHSKGFFFVFVSFILMMYIFLYLVAWINAMEISEKTASEKFRTASIQGIVSALSEKRFLEFFDIAGNYAFFKINDHASNIASPMKYDANDELKYLRNAFFGVVFNGYSDDFEGNVLVYSPTEIGIYTFKAWLDNLNRTLATAGMEIVSFEAYDKKFNQTSPVTFNASMNITFFVRDRLSRISINRTFHLEQEFNISGLVDPMIKREFMRISSNMSVEKQIFYRELKPEDLAPVNVVNGTAGQGFFYGPMIVATAVTPDFPSPGERGQYILVGNFSQIKTAYAWQEYGAYILTNEPENETRDGCSAQSEKNTFLAVIHDDADRDGNCSRRVEEIISQPFAVVPNFNISKFTGPNGKRYALFISKYAVDEVGKDLVNTVFLKNHPVGVYDIEALRDATICSYFFPSSRAPSYAQRLTMNALYLNSTYGIETFLVGKWAGGTDLVNYDNYSRVDFEFFRKIEGTKIRGMPGCKTYQMCLLNTGDDAPLGHFRLSAESMKRYYVGDIACNDGRARCDP